MNDIDEIMDPVESRPSKMLTNGCISDLSGPNETSDTSTSADDDKSSRPSNDTQSARAVTATNTTSSTDSCSNKGNRSNISSASGWKGTHKNKNQYRKRAYEHLDCDVIQRYETSESLEKSSLSTDVEPDSDGKAPTGDKTCRTWAKGPGERGSNQDLPLTAHLLHSRYGPLKRSSFITVTSSSHANSDMAPMEDVPEPNSENTASENGSYNGGYSASASSNDVFCIGQDSCSSPSMSSSEDLQGHAKRRFRSCMDPAAGGEESRRSETSSDIADFSSTNSARRSSSPSSYSSRDDELTGFDLEKPILDDQVEEHSYIPLNAPPSPLARKRRLGTNDTTVSYSLKQEYDKNSHPSVSANGIVSYSLDTPSRNMKMDYPALNRRQMQVESTHKHSSHKSMNQDASIPTMTKPLREHELKINESRIYSVGVDVMAHIMSFLDPMDSHRFLTMPISKTFRTIYTQPQDLWKILCLSDPFLVKINDREGSNSSGDESSGSFPICNQLGIRHTLGKYRLLYTSFIRCVRYLVRIKDDAIHGRLPIGDDEEMDASGDETVNAIGNSASLMEFFAQAREFIHDDRHDMTSDSDTDSVDRQSRKSPGIFQSVEVSDDKQMIVRNNRPTVKYSHSTLTDRLLGPSKDSRFAGPVELPWSCAIYSVVNWLVAFADVEGIQIMCLKVLPYLLEDENQRTIAQRAGLTDIVLRAMVLFPSSVALHTASFHTLVLLARPLGGREGMLFHVAMLNTSGILCSKSGIAVMLDSMKRFANDEVLQAMACWSLVNIALIPAQKKVLVSLGGIATAANAMMNHPLNPDVQFRALFALINLVIPSNNIYESSAEGALARTQLADIGGQNERELLDDSVTQIASLVVLAMRNFCASEAILNRACLVLHNLSLNEEYHRILLFTPHCYQMLEWCIANYRNDSVLQQSAGGTLQRLQLSLASDDILRSHFAETLRSQEVNAGSDSIVA